MFANMWKALLHTIWQKARKQANLKCPNQWKSSTFLIQHTQNPARRNLKKPHFKNKSNNRAGAYGVSTIQLPIHHIYTTSDDCFSQMIVDILYTAHKIWSSKLGDKKLAFFFFFFAKTQNNYISGNWKGSLHLSWIWGIDCWPITLLKYNYTGMMI